MNNLDEIIEKFKNKEGFECHGQLNEEIVDEMECKLEITFPEQYKAFLRKYGYIEWYGHAVFGYSTDEDYCTVESTIAYRDGGMPSEFERISQEGCILEYYGGGGYYFLFSNTSARAGQVALYIDESFGQEVRCWQTFEEFLIYMYSL